MGCGFPDGIFGSSGSGFVGGFQNYNNQWYQYDFGSAQLVTAYDVWGPHNMDHGYWPYTWRLEGSDDGSTWTEYDYVSNHNTNKADATTFESSQWSNMPNVQASDDSGAVVW